MARSIEELKAELEWAANQEVSHLTTPLEKMLALVKVLREFDDKVNWKVTADGRGGFSIVRIG